VNAPVGFVADDVLLLTGAACEAALMPLASKSGRPTQVDEYDSDECTAVLRFESRGLLWTGTDCAIVACRNEDDSTEVETGDIVPGERLAGRFEAVLNKYEDVENSSASEPTVERAVVFGYLAVSVFSISTCSVAVWRCTDRSPDMILVATRVRLSTRSSLETSL